MAQEHGYRLVHLDLKGAPPKLSYFQQLFPLLKKWGANGLLVEYEDMFPYEGELKLLASSFAYSKDDILALRELAKESGLLVIPLVQTFGHFEFVLKHPEFSRLREVPEHARSLCPSNPDSIRIVNAMLDQVLELHPNLRWFHIGADEVYHVGECDACKARMTEKGLTKQNLFMSHVREVASSLKQKSPTTQVIMWDDMFRSSEARVLKESGIGGLVEPMVWHYQPCDIPVVDIWEKYSQVFSHVWFGSAYKGATGICQQATDISYHLGNHRMWLTVMEKERTKFTQIRGIALTGWQRYDHFAVLCELLPESVPSLGLCLQTIDTGSFTPEVHQKVSKDLKCKGLLPLNPFNLAAVPDCDFPGGQIYKLSLELVHLDVQLNCNINSALWSKSDKSGNLKVSTDSQQRSALISDLERLLNEYEEIKQKFARPLAEIFFPHTIQEWIQVHITTKTMKLKEHLSA